MWERGTGSGIRESGLSSKSTALQKRWREQNEFRCHFMGWTATSESRVKGAKSNELNHMSRDKGAESKEPSQMSRVKGADSNESRQRI